MTASTRTVRHLRLRAGSEAAVRRVLPVLEDALRCASLGDGGGRLLVMRRLALGTLPPDITSQALALRIEECAAQAAQRWVEADSPAAEDAACVAFRGALEARMQLALRLVRGQACTAWYWPRAVAEFDVRAGTAVNLRAMAWAIVSWPEARVALPAWIAAVAEAPAGAARLAVCMPAEDGAALVGQAGLGHRLERLVRQGARCSVPSPSEQMETVPGASAPYATAWPEWLQTLAPSVLQAMAAPSALSPSPGSAMRSDEGRAGGRIVRDPTPLPAARRREIPGANLPERERLPSRRVAPADPTNASEQDAPLDTAHAATAPAATPPEPLVLSPLTALASRRVDGDPFLDPTACGGLLFLLPLLQRLGLAERLPPEDDTFAARVLGAALQLLRAAEDDPAWHLVPTEPCGAEVRSHVQAWLAAVRSWLRRRARMSLAALVLRPARLALTPTHADITFDMAQADLRVRRLGLDVDPGWLPWFGRVVAFHYERGTK